MNTRILTSSLLAGALFAASTSAQTVVAVNDVRDLPDTDLLDGVIDADAGALGEQRTLRAILEHINFVGGAWRVILPPQTLVLTRWGADDACHWGDLDLYGAGVGFLSIEGAPGLSAIDASGFGTSPATADRIFDVRGTIGAGATLRISDVRLVFGSRPAMSHRGGGIQHESGATLELNNVSIESCNSGNGGGLYAGGPVAMTSGAITNCSALVDGGGLFVQSGVHVDLDGVQIANGSAAQYGGGVFVAPDGSLAMQGGSVLNGVAIEGGGVRSRGTLNLVGAALIGGVANSGSGSGGNVSVRNSSGPLPSTMVMDGCTVGAGSAGAGAGVYVGVGASATILRSSIELNVGTTLGGGLSNQGSTSVFDSTFSDNEASEGGGVHNFGVLSLRNCTVSRNRATTHGGGLNLSGLATHSSAIDACTIAFNMAPSGAGIQRDGVFGAPLAEIKNTFVASNRQTATGNPLNSSGNYAFTSHGFNVDTDGTCQLGPGSYSGTLGAPLYTGLGPLDFNGGPTRTHELLYCSPANCRGDVVYMDGTANDYDQRGVQRDSPPDAGAYDAPIVTLAGYCTSGVTTNGCQAVITATGMYSPFGACNLDVHVSNVEGQRQGLIYYGVNGPTAAPWGSGSTSWMCVKAPVQRTGTQNSGGAAGTCSGSFDLNFSAWSSANPGALGWPYPPNGAMWLQAWFRDPPSPKTTNLSNAIEVPVCP